MKLRNKGFSLVELIIVIGIIAVLMTVMLTTFGGATESAKSAKCMSNLRNLTVAVQNCAMASGSTTGKGFYPAAGSHEYVDVDSDRKVVYNQRKGWISAAANTHDRKGSTRQATGISMVNFDADVETVRYALTNGVLWTYVDHNYKTYRCPVHEAKCRSANSSLKQGPGWSYVMNCQFGRDNSGSSDWRAQSFGGMVTRKKTDVNAWRNGVGFDAPDRMLLFCEMPAIESNTDRAAARMPNTVLHSGGKVGDPVLDFADGETIGFNHKNGKRWAGHVAFADGHVATITLPNSGDVESLTTWLCQGDEISYNGNSYTRVSSVLE